MKNKVYTGEIGELYGVSFLPYYMKNWSVEKITIFCDVLNCLEKLNPKLGKKLEKYLIDHESN